MPGRVTRLVYQPAKLQKPQAVDEESAIGSARNMLSTIMSDPDATSGSQSGLAGILKKRKKKKSPDGGLAGII